MPKAMIHHPPACHAPLEALTLRVLGRDPFMASGWAKLTVRPQWRGAWMSIIWAATWLRGR